MNNRHLFSQPQWEGFPRGRRIGPGREVFYPEQGTWEADGIARTGKGGTRK